MVLVSTGRLCHISSTGSGTSPSSLRLNRFSIHPCQPVISALGIRGVLAMPAPPVDVVNKRRRPCAVCDSRWDQKWAWQFHRRVAWATVGTEPSVDRDDRRGARPQRPCTDATRTDGSGAPTDCCGQRRSLLGPSATSNRRAQGAVESARRANAGASATDANSSAAGHGPGETADTVVPRDPSQATGDISPLRHTWPVPGGDVTGRWAPTSYGWPRRQRSRTGVFMRNPVPLAEMRSRWSRALGQQARDVQDGCRLPRVERTTAPLGAPAIGAET